MFGLLLFYIRVYEWIKFRTHNEGLGAELNSVSVLFIIRQTADSEWTPL